MAEVRVVPRPASPASGARPDAFEIDGDLESALLAGLADGPEEPDGPAFETDSGLAGPPGGTAGYPAAPPGAGASAARSAPLPADQPEPGAGSGPRNGIDLPDPTPEPPLNGDLEPPPDLEAAPGGGLPESPTSSSEDRYAAAGGGEAGPDGSVDPALADATPGDPLPFTVEAGPESARWSEFAFDEEPAERSLVSIAARDEPPGHMGPGGPGDGIPAAAARDGLLDELDDESVAFETEPDFDPGFETSFEPGAPEEGSVVAPVAPAAGWSSPHVAADPDLERTLRDGLSDGSAGDPPPEEPATSASGAGPDPENTSHHDPGSVPPIPSPEVLAFEAEPDLDTSLPGDSLHPPGIPGAPPAEPAPSPSETDPAAGIVPIEDAPAAPAAGGEPAVLAFATDPESESALREGLSEHANPLVWPGGLRNAIATLGAGPSSPLLFVDLDETAYPAGAIHELAAVCEVGTVVIAFGSAGTARFSREVLLAGVSDYLVKPITAAAVREAAARAAASARSEAVEDRGGGWSIGFAGTGGSGATTLAAAAALLAAERGRYVSVLDLNRTFPALSFLLDVEPAPGLVELLSTVARASLHPEVVDGMRAERSDRVAVYGYPWSAVPPPLPPVWAVCELLVELQRRSHLVIVDGLDDPATRTALLAMVDARVLVVEPTETGAASAARMLDRFAPMFDPDWPFLLVQNHTRALRPRAGARALRDAGVEAAPDVVIPFEPALPAHADRGWPEGRLPRALRKSLGTFVDRILAAPPTASALA